MISLVNVTKSSHLLKKSLMENFVFCAVCIVNIKRLKRSFFWIDVRGRDYLSISEKNGDFGNLI